MKVKDLTGQKFGKLTVLKIKGMDKWGHSLWLCKCECGKETIIISTNLKSGNSTKCRSCGRPEIDPKKLKDIIKLRKQGISFQKIGDKYGVSRQAIHQILMYHKI